MIQKRYQIYTKNGVEWTPWFNTSIQGDVEELNKRIETKYQLKSSKLKNEYREYRV